MRPEDRNRLLHMIEAAESAQHFLAGRSREDLDHDRMLLFALTRAIEILGEAASKVSTEARAKLPAVPWSRIVAMRNRLAHAYFDIDRNILWRTVAEELPELLRLLRRSTSDT